MFKFNVDFSSLAGFQNGLYQEKIHTQIIGKILEAIGHFRRSILEAFAEQFSFLDLLRLGQAFDLFEIHVFQIPKACQSSTSKINKTRRQCVSHLRLHWK